MGRTLDVTLKSTVDAMYKIQYSYLKVRIAISNRLLLTYIPKYIPQYLPAQYIHTNPQYCTYHVPSNIPPRRQPRNSSTRKKNLNLTHRLKIFIDRLQYAEKIF